MYVAQRGACSPKAILKGVLIEIYWSEAKTKHEYMLYNTIQKQIDTVGAVGLFGVKFVFDDIGLIYSLSDDVSCTNALYQT